MKKSLLTLALGVTGIAAWCAAPTYEWSKLIDSPQTQDLTSKVVLCTDGNPVTLSQFGSRTNTDNISFDGEVIATGAYTTSNSDNANLLIIKHNATDGSRIWSVSSKEGDIIISSAGNIIGTADGGVLALLNMRSSNVTPYTSPVLVDHSGAEVEFPDWNTSVWIYNQVLVKINKDGNIEWTRTVVMDQLPGPKASSGNSVNATTNGVTPYALAQDSDGNIYIGGNYRAPMVVGGVDNGTFVLTARNVDSYNGDSQQAAGGMYLIKLDSEGYYQNHLRATGTLTRDQICNILIDGTTLYFTGNVRGNVGDELTIGGKALTIGSTFDGIMVGSVSTDLKTVNYLTYIKPYGNKSSKNAVKLRDLKLIGGSLYVVGGGTGGFGPADGAEAMVQSTGTLEEGWMLKLNPADGAWEDAANNDINIGAYLGMFEYSGNIYVLGYRLNATDGVFLDEYPLSGNLERAARHTIVKGGGAPTGYSVAFDPETTRMFAVARGNNTFTLADGSSSDKPTSWGGVVTSCYFDKSAGVNGISDDASAFTATGEDGVLVVNSTEDVKLNVVDTKGVTVVSRDIVAGETRIPLAAGIYIANSVKVLVK